MTTEQLVVRLQEKQQAYILYTRRAMRPKAGTLRKLEEEMGKLLAELERRVEERNVQG